MFYRLDNLKKRRTADRQTLPISAFCSAEINLVAPFCGVCGESKH